MPVATVLRCRIASLFKQSAVLDLCICLLLLGATVGYALTSGKDLNFDQLNYHFYLAYSFLHDRLGHDFVAANGQSYLNPLAYVPFYVMVKGGWDSLLISSILAMFHAVNIVLAYFITKAVMPEGHRQARTFATLGAALAFLSPVFLAEAGTTFADVSTSVFVLAAIYIAQARAESNAWWKDRATLAGVLMGAAGALKLSNLVFGPAVAVLLLIMDSPLRRRIRAMVLLGAGSLTGFAIVNGYWSWKLWQTLGNPFFPLFSNYFPTDSFPREGAMLERFLPKTFWDALDLPFRMMQSRSWVYIESISPDLRFAAATLLALTAAAVILRRNAVQKVMPASVNSRRALALSVFFVCGYATWQWTSGNGRYGLVLSVICGPLLALFARLIFTNDRRGALLLGGLCALQTIHLQSGELRWTHGPWTHDWYEVLVPERLRREPFLYISVGNNSNSYIFPYLAETSAFTNPFGQIAFDLDGPGGRELTNLLASYKGRIRMIAAAPPLEQESDFLPLWTAANDSYLSRIGYAIDAKDCEVISATGPAALGGQDFKPDAPAIQRMRTCLLTPKPFGLVEERSRMTKIAKEVVRWCPKLFKPTYTVMERSIDGWSASYPSTDSMLVIKDGMIYGVFVRATANIQLGSVDDWERGERPSCASLPDRPRETYTFD